MRALAAVLLVTACGGHEPCDGVVGAGEECDDGNQNPDDGCDCHAHPPWVAPAEGLRPDGFVVIEDDGAFCWFQDERAIFTDSRLAVASVSHAGDIQVSSYDLATGARDHGMLHRSLERDDHDAPSLLPLPDGRIAAFYTRHDGFDDMRWRIAASTDLTDWGPERRFAIANNVTYSNPFLLDDGLHVFFRGLRYNPTVAISDDLGETWRKPRQLIDSHSDGAIQRTDQRPYVKYASNGADTVHVFYTEGHPAEFGQTSLYHLVYRHGELARSDGTPAGAQDLAPTAGTRIHDGAADGATWPWDAAVDRAGHPVVVYSVATAEHTHTYRYARWTGTAWQTALVGEGGTAIYPDEPFYAGGITIDPDDPSVVYFASNAAGGHFELFRGTTGDGGLTWTVAAVTRGSSVDNLRPIVPAHHPPGTAVVWMQGTYQSYIDTDTRIVGLFGAANAQLVAPPLEEPVAPAAKLEHLQPGANTQNGITVTLSNVAPIAGHAIAGNGCGWHTALALDIAGLPGDVRAVLRLHAVDRGAHYLAPMLWYRGVGWWDDATLELGGLPVLLGAHRLANSSDGGESYADILLGRTDRRVLGTGLCTNGDASAFVDAIEVFPLTDRPAVAVFDVNRGGNHWSDRDAVPLELGDDSFVASATAGPITITVTTDQLDDRGPNGPYMNYGVGTEAVLGHDGLVVDVTGLTPGKRYTIYVASTARDQFLYQSSRWRLDEPGREPRVVAGMHINGGTEPGGFVFFHHATASSFRLRVTDVFYAGATDPSVVLFGGMSIVELPE